MKIEHRLRAFGRCPVDGAVDAYDICVRTGRVIKVEEINAVVAALVQEPVLQENFTKSLAIALSASVETVCVHSGVETTCLV